ncbi:hypothetical protein FOCC_FOCC009277 [Frankliniella occidentalis]|nr:hypothetical protein FOCC_FOCC009277 [Frankliniella occidentalis]
MGEYTFYCDKKNHEKGVWYFRCSESRKDPPCHTTAKSYVPNVDELQPNNNRRHSHQPAYPLREAYLRHREDLINLCLRQKSCSLKKIIDSYVNNLEDQRLVDSFTIESIKKAVNRLRNMNLPPVPHTLRQASESLEMLEFSYLGRNRDDTQDFYQGLVGERGQESLLFVNLELMHLVGIKSVLASDATFYCCPRLLGAKQVLIFAFHAYGQVFPFAYAVMTSKTTASYAHIIQRLKDLGLRAKLVTTDWETAEQKAWKQVYKNIELWGCLFHYQRAVYRQAKKKKLTRHLKKGGSNKDVARILKLLSVLPRLPANEIKKGFKVIKQEAEKTLDGRLKKKMDKLFQYFNNQWLIKTSAEELSVHGKNVRVTSGLESINARINDLMPMKHPHFWIWLDLLKDFDKEITKKYDDIRIGKGQSGSSKYYKKDTDRLTDHDIRRALLTFEGHKNHLEFLIAIQPTYNNVLAVLHITDEDTPDNIPTDEEVLAQDTAQILQAPTRRSARLMINSESEHSEIDEPSLNHDLTSGLSPAASESGLANSPRPRPRPPGDDFVGIVLTSPTGPSFTPNRDTLLDKSTTPKSTESWHQAVTLESNSVDNGKFKGYV